MLLWTETKQPTANPSSCRHFFVDSVRICSAFLFLRKNNWIDPARTFWIFAFFFQPYTFAYSAQPVIVTVLLRPEITSRCHGQNDQLFILVRTSLSCFRAVQERLACLSDKFPWSALIERTFQTTDQWPRSYHCLIPGVNMVWVIRLLNIPLFLLCEKNPKSM